MPTESTPALANTRECKNCGKRKPLNAFRAERGCVNGRGWVCRACNNAMCSARVEAAKAAFLATGVTTKECPSCGEVKPLSAFNSLRYSGNGFSKRCRSCISTTQAQNADAASASSSVRFCTKCRTLKPATDFGRIESRCRSCGNALKRARDSVERELLNRWRQGEDVSDLTAELRARLDVAYTPKVTLDPMRSMARNACRRCRVISRKLGVESDITRDWLLEKFHGRCEVTGLPFDFSVPHGPFGPSVDRIVPGSPYLMANVRIVVLIYNTLRLNHSDADVLRMARALVARADALPQSRPDPQFDGYGVLRAVGECVGDGDAVGPLRVPGRGPE